MVDYDLDMAQSDQVAFQDAGFTDVRHHQMGRPLQYDALIVPARPLAIEDGCIVDRIPVEGSQYNLVKATDRILSPFVRLADAPETSILRFAQRYGMLGAVRATDSLEGGADLIKWDGARWFFYRRGATLWTKQERSVSEPLGLWRYLSSAARAMLRVAATLNESLPKPGAPADWQLLGVDLSDPVTFQTFGVADARFFLCDEVNKWLSLGRVTLRMEPSDDFSSRRTRWQTLISGAGLVGALAMQLMLVVSGAESLYVCSGCKLPYIRPGKRSRAGLNNYCPECGIERAMRDADRRRKQKMADVRQDRAAGLGLRELATKYNTKPATVRGWVKGQGDGKTTRTR